VDVGEMVRVVGPVTTDVVRTTPAI